MNCPYDAARSHASAVVEREFAGARATYLAQTAGNRHSLAERNRLRLLRRHFFVFDGAPQTPPDLLEAHFQTFDALAPSYPKAPQAAATTPATPAIPASGATPAIPASGASDTSGTSGTPGATWCGCSSAVTPRVRQNHIACARAADQARRRSCTDEVIRSLQGLVASGFVDDLWRLVLEFVPYNRNLLRVVAAPPPRPRILNELKPIPNITKLPAGFGAGFGDFRSEDPDTAATVFGFGDPATPTKEVKSVLLSLAAPSLKGSSLFRATIDWKSDFKRITNPVGVQLPTHRGLCPDPGLHHLFSVDANVPYWDSDLNLVWTVECDYDPPTRSNDAPGLMFGLDPVSGDVKRTLPHYRNSVFFPPLHGEHGGGEAAVPLLRFLRPRGGGQLFECTAAASAEEIVPPYAPPGFYFADSFGPPRLQFPTVFSPGDLCAPTDQSSLTSEEDRPAVTTTTLTPHEHESVWVNSVLHTDQSSSTSEEARPAVTTTTLTPHEDESVWVNSVLHTLQWTFGVVYDFPPFLSSRPNVE